jgi:surface antigen
MMTGLDSPSSPGLEEAPGRIARRGKADETSVNARPGGDRYEWSGVRIMLRMLKSTKLAAVLLGAASLTAMVSTAAQADPPGWHGGHGYHKGWGPPVVVVHPYAPPPVVYAPPPAVVYAPPPPVVYAPAPTPVVVPAPVAAAPAYVCTDSGNATALGVAAGGTAGALIGAASSHGHTRWGTTAGGAILGMLLGGSIGSAVDASNRNCTATAVAYAPVGTPVAWTNANVQYQVVPTRQYNYNGETCRDYQANAAINGQWQQVHGTACLQPDGSWRIVN